MRILVGMSLLMALVGAGAAHAEANAGGSAWDCAGQSAQRPYVCDIGAAEPLSMHSFKELVRKDAALRATVARIGMPDAAELQRVLVNDPWADFEVRIYYRQYNRMYVFGRAFILGNPEVSHLRHEGPIPATWLASRRPAARSPGAARSAEAAAPGLEEEEVRRAEASAARAEEWAAEVEALADRAEFIADSMAADFPERLRKN